MLGPYRVLEKLREGGTGEAYMARPARRCSVAFRAIRLFLLACLLLLTWAPGAGAQEQSGSIRGTVRDSAGLIVRGATVEALSVSGTGRHTTVTDEKGAYRFPALPPGIYTVTSEFQDFSPATVKDVLLTLGQVLTIDLTLAVQPTAEAVEITGASPLIDVRQSASFATLRADIFSRLFMGTDFTAAVQIAPGARAEAKAGGIQIDGASGAEHRFIIDGMDTTNVRTGVSGKPMLADFVEEMQVKSSGYAAEFGGAVGGVVTARTKSGTNQLHGSAGFYEANNRFKGPVRPGHGYNLWTDQPESNLLEYRVPWQMWNAVGEIGGPAVKDRLWYYGAFSYSSNTYDEDATFVTDSTLTPRRITQTNPAYMINYEGAAAIGRNLRLRATGSNQRNRTRGTLPAVMPDGTSYYGTNPRLYGKDMYGYTTGTFDTNADGTINQAAYDARWILSGSDSQNDMYSANLDWVVTPSVFLNVMGGYYRINVSTPPEARGNSIVRGMATSMTNAWMTSRGYPTIPARYQQNRGFTDNISNSGTLKDMYDRADVSANATWFGSLAGQHMVKAGVRFERIGNDVYSGYTKPRINFFWGSPYQHSDGRVLSGKYGYYVVSQPVSAGTMHPTNVAFWLQDSWTVGARLTVNAGVRMENEHIPTYTQAPGEVDIRFGFGDKVAPRLGFAYDVRGDGRSKVYGSFGYFYDVLKLEMPRGLFGADHWVVNYWGLDTYDWSSVSCGEGTTPCPGTFFESLNMRIPATVPNPVLAEWFNRPGMTGIDPNLKPMKAGELTFGFEHQLGSTVALNARYVHKWLVRTIEDVGIHVPDFGEVYLVGNPGFGYTEVMEPAWPQFTTPKAQRDYDALEFRLRKRFSSRLGGEVNYTYSRLRGNYGGLASSDENGRVSPNVNRYFDAPYMSYDDNNHVVSGPLATDRPHFLNLVGEYDFPWGTAVSLAVAVGSGLPQTSEFYYQNYPVYYHGRNDLGRLPAFSQVNLQVQQEFRLGGTGRLALQAVIWNLFDQKNVIGYYSVTPYRDSVLMPNDNLFFGGPWDPAQMVALRRAQGVIIRDDVWFKTSNTYQAPREVRFGVRFRF